MRIKDGELIFKLRINGKRDEVGMFYAPYPNWLKGYWGIYRVSNTIVHEHGRTFLEAIRNYKRLCS